MKIAALKMMSAAILIVSLTATAFAQERETENIKKKLPMLQSTSSLGTDFWFTVPPCAQVETSSDDWVTLIVTSPGGASVTIEQGENKFLRKLQLAPKEVQQVFISPNNAMPWTKSTSAVPPAEAVTRGAGIHVYSDSPIIVYCTVKFYSTSDGFLVYPVSMLGSEYITSSYTSMDALTSSKMPSLTGCCATTDDTQVSFTIGGNKNTTTAGGLTSGKQSVYYLNKGDVVMVATNAVNADLSGSIWKSNKPLAVVSGNFCANIPVDNKWCDYVAEMDLPTYLWGLNYHVPQVANRKYASLVRIYAKEAGTKIYRDGVQLLSLTSAGGEFAKGWFETRLVPIGNKPSSAVISADKPIGVTLCNTGIYEDGTPMPNSEPFMMAMLPVEGYNTEVSFATPAVDIYKGYSENYLDVVFETGTSGEIPDDIVLGYGEDGKYSYTRLKEMDSVVVEQFTYNVNGTKYAKAHLPLPKLGAYQLHAEKPFAAYSYGYGNCDSYGFPSGIPSHYNANDTVPPVPSWTMECNGNVTGATVEDMPLNTDRSGLNNIVLDKSSYNYRLQKGTIVFGETNETNWELEVIDINKPSKAVVIFFDAAGNDTAITVQNNMSKIVFSTDTLDFGYVIPDSVYRMKFSMKNTGTEAITVKSIGFWNGSKGFTIEGITLPVTMLPDESKEITLKFSQSINGHTEDRLVVGDSCASLLGGVNVGANPVQPHIIVTDIDFGARIVGQACDTTFLIRNISAVDINIIGITGKTLTEFTTDLPPVPFKVPSNTRLTYTVNFQSDREGTFIDTLVFESEAGTYTDNISVFRVKTVKGNSVESDGAGQEAPGLKIAVIPNPASGGRATVRLVSDRDCGAEIIVCNIAGEQLFNSRTYTVLAGENTIELDLAKLPSGTYYLLVKSCGSVKRVKFGIVK